MTPIRILIVEDHAMVRHGLISLLVDVPDVEVVGAATDGMEAIQVFPSLQPDITLIDLQMPRMGGVETIHKIREQWPLARFIVLTTFDGDEDIYRAMQAGARAYLLKGMEVEELLVTIRAVHAGRAHIPPTIANKLAQRISAQDLTAREVNVLQRIVAGRANKEIADDLNISEATVKSHVNNLLGKLGVGDRTSAAIVAVQRGIVHLS